MKQKVNLILVVDDERDHADGIAESLEKLCTKAMAVYTGKDALEIVRSQHVDIVVTDLKFEDEDINGYPQGWNGQQEAHVFGNGIAKYIKNNTGEQN